MLDVPIQIVAKKDRRGKVVRQTAIEINAEQAVELLDDKTNLIAECHRYGSLDGKKFLCHVPLVSEEAMEAVSLETDASQYGEQVKMTPKKRKAFRVARAERSLCDEERQRAIMEKQRDVSFSNRTAPS